MSAKFPKYHIILPAFKHFYNIAVNGLWHCTNLVSKTSLRASKYRCNITIYNLVILNKGS